MGMDLKDLPRVVQRHWRHAFVEQVERRNSNLLSLAGVNGLCKHFTLQIDFFFPVKSEGKRNTGNMQRYFRCLLNGDHRQPFDRTL